MGHGVRAVYIYEKNQPLMYYESYFTRAFYTLEGVISCEAALSPQHPFNTKFIMCYLSSIRYINYKTRMSINSISGVKVK